MDGTGGLRRVLCVDDEPNILEGLERTLFDHFEVTTAPSGASGLSTLSEDGPFAVVVSDMRMPEMDGAEFLSQVKAAAPDTVRILLTGQADLKSAIASVNEGNIFRFLNKPCPQDLLVESLELAVEQYRLVHAERELLERTLKGSVQVLTEVLNLAAPAAFNRANQLKVYVDHMAAAQEPEEAWKYEMAVMLCQLGCITLPPETLERAFAGQPISDQEQQMLDEHPEIGHRLLAHIPRLESVAQMILGQRDPTTVADPADRLGAEMIAVAKEIDRRVVGGGTVQDGVAAMERDTRWNRELLASLKDFEATETQEVVKALRLKDLTGAMTLDQDVRTTGGMLVVGKDSRLSAALIERLRNFAKGMGIEEPIRIRMKAGEGA